MSSVDIDNLCNDFLIKNSITKLVNNKTVIEPVIEPVIETVADSVIESVIEPVIEKVAESVIEINTKLFNILSLSFEKCVKGYHIINDEPIKETPWEDINVQILNASGCNIISQSNGSHKSGADLFCSIGELSNKSTQYESGNKAFRLSSYRLTTVCSDKIPGNIDDIIFEINKRKNFTYYSIIVREEKDTEIMYDWYLIPSDCIQLNPSSYKWKPKIGIKGKNKNTITGWETDKIEGSSMSITFSMSSQLWIYVNITDKIKKYMICSCKVNKGRKYNYIQIYDKYYL